MKRNRIVTFAVIILMIASFLLLEYGEGPIMAQVPGAEAGATNIPLAEEDLATFQVAPEDDWVRSRNSWTPGTTISLTIEDGGGVVYADSHTADAGGDFQFSLGGGVFDVQRGHVVSVSDGITSKTHTVTNLFVDGVDVAADTVFGRADASSDVEVWVHGGGNLTVTADSSGNWVADFSGMTDLTFLSDGGSQQLDGDGDSTGVWWATSPSFQVAPDDDWVRSYSSWTPGATISLTIADGSGVLYIDSQTADAYGSFHFSLGGGIFDLQRGHMVTVSDGITTKSHVVTYLFVDGVDVAADTVFGRAAVGSDVDVWVHDDNRTSLTVTADGSGNWVADFSGMTDLAYVLDGGSQQYDYDGDTTSVWWVTSPRFEVAPDDDWVRSLSRWTPGATISLTIEDGGGVVYTDSQTADANGSFHFGLGDVFDVQRGHVVTVSDGTTSKTHTVIDLFWDGIDVAADTVFGRADAGSEVQVWVHDNNRTTLTVTADGSGNWVADFSGKTDLTYASDGGSQQFDNDGDTTSVWWAAPRFQVSPEGDWVESRSRWMPGATISLTIEDGGGVAYADSQTADANGNFNFNMGGGIFDVQRGHVVTVSDGINSKVHTVTNLFVDGIDVDADTVFGRADAGADVNVWVHDDFGTNLTVTADGSGNWTADFSTMIDLTYGSDGGSQQFDEDGDATGVWWDSPAFQVAPEDDWVGSSSQWVPGATISLTIEDGGGVVYADSQTADAGGHFHFGLGGIFDMQRGHVVTVSDGISTKTHTVIALFVDGVDVDADTVFGRAEAGADVNVWVHDNGSLTVTADGSGNWVADFSGMTDLTYFSDGGSQQFDEDGDATGVWWDSPAFQVAPEDDWVQSSSPWTPGATISLTIEDGGGVVYADSQTADAYGNFNFNLGGVFDLQRGHVVTVSDGISTKTHTVIALFVDGVDVDADTVFGRAEAGAEVEVWVHDNGSLTVTADGSGNWVADFSGMTDLTYFSDGGSQQMDDDGDATGVWWAGASVQEIYLNEGWNMISSSIEAGDPAVASILADIVDDVVLMKNGNGEVYWPNIPGCVIEQPGDCVIDQIGDWDVHQGYQIYMANGAMLRIYGAIVDPAATPIELAGGWSLIAYLRDDSTPVGPALDTISGALYLAKNGAGEVYWPAYGVDQIGDMQPGQGYQVYMDGPGTLTYP